MARISSNAVNYHNIKVFMPMTVTLKIIAVLLHHVNLHHSLDFFVLKGQSDDFY